MPLYEFRCHGCGLFDVRRGMAQAADGADCPACGRSARRVYSTGADVADALPGAGQLERARWDRARSGEPVVTGAPARGRLGPGH